MSSNIRLWALAALFIAGIALILVVTISHTDTPLSSSLSPAFQLLGTPIKSVDHLVTRVIPVNDLDERDLGIVLRARYDSQVNDHDSDLIYVNELIGHLTKHSTKPFEYKVYRLDWKAPNAMALPGGVILITTGLLETLQSESELAAILGHEIGHIELGHCLDAVKFKLLGDKIGSRSFGAITDLAVRLLLSHSFSKTQEDDADTYGYELILSTPYDPLGVGRAFASFMRYKAENYQDYSTNGKISPIRDYFQSHPPMEIREAKFTATAGAWWRRNKDAVRYEGVDNLRTLITIYAEHSLQF